MTRSALVLLVLAGLAIGVLAACDRDDGESHQTPHQGPAGDDDDVFADDDTDDDSGAETQPDWYRQAVFMEIFVRSYQDSDGDGIGDLPGLTSRLPYLASLGVRGLWLMPIYPTEFVDSGYDVSDYTAINPEYGTMDDFRRFLDTAHDLGIRVLLDGVFNHTSDQHAWFQESRSSRDNTKRDWYVWEDEPTFTCDNPTFPDPDVGWTYDDATGQYYFHYFRAGQPDLNYENPAVRQAILDVVRFWFDRGVDGFRLDVAGLYYNDAQYCEHHPKTHAFLKEMRAVADEYGDRVLLGEVAGWPKQVAEYYGDGDDELQLAFQFQFTYTLYASLLARAPFLYRAYMGPVRAALPDGARMTEFLTNHDFYRATGILLGDERRLRLAASLLLTLPGTPFLMYGEEVGMANGREVVVDYRDAARTPMQWDATEQAGFTTGEPWIALSPNHTTHNVAAMSARPDSLLAHYRRWMAVRNEHPVFAGDEFRPLSAQPAGLIDAYIRGRGAEALVVLHNFADTVTTATLRRSALPWPKCTVVRDIFGERPLRVDRVSASMELEAGGTALLSCRVP